MNLLLRIPSHNPFERRVMPSWLPSRGWWKSRSAQLGTPVVRMQRTLRTPPRLSVGARRFRMRFQAPTRPAAA
jgi:hypothetical protein